MTDQPARPPIYAKKPERKNTPKRPAPRPNVEIKKAGRAKHSLKPMDSHSKQS